MYNDSQSILRLESFIIINIFRLKFRVNKDMIYQMCQYKKGLRLIILCLQLFVQTL